MMTEHHSKLDGTNLICVQPNGHQGKPDMLIKIDRQVMVSTHKILKLAESPQKLGMAPQNALEEKFKAWS